MKPKGATSGAGRGKPRVQKPPERRVIDRSVKVRRTRSQKAEASGATTAKTSTHEETQEDARAKQRLNIVLPSIVLSMPSASHPCASESQRLAFSKAETEYLETVASPSTRASIVAAFEAMAPESEPPVRFRIAQSNLPNKMDIVKRLGVCESGKMASWVEQALRLPLKQYAPPPAVAAAELPAFLASMRRSMDAEMFGQQAAKDELMRIACQWIRSGSLMPFAIGLEGPPGIGAPPRQREHEEVGGVDRRRRAAAAP